MANKSRAKATLGNKYRDSMANFKDLMQNFKRTVSNAGILQEYKDHEYYSTESEKKRKKRQDARKKAQIENIQNRIQAGDPVRASKGLVKKAMSGMNKKKRG